MKKRAVVHTNGKWKEKCQESKQRIGKVMWDLSTRQEKCLSIEAWTGEFC